ncbi:hypothetical protein I551_4177 [Mycobacterium ulcerans str. Harvey]|uniref:Uncharacterized protein n=1 Tax=Mycobacterium ulcerans str. Harvey TaxID=1299332 RepID=A0ABN0QX76_MYCUL|nr:hypothetical protein I551_4177 [Mycobacterium ulcerans str. Harvey]
MPVAAHRLDRHARRRPGQGRHIGVARAKDFPMLAATLPPSRAVLPAVAASRAPARSGAVTRPKPGRYRVIELFTLPSTDSRLVCQELPSGLAASRSHHTRMR